MVGKQVAYYTGRSKNAPIRMQLGQKPVRCVQDRKIPQNLMLIWQTRTVCGWEENVLNNMLIDQTDMFCVCSKNAQMMMLIWQTHTPCWCSINALIMILIWHGDVYKCEIYLDNSRYFSKPTQCVGPHKNNENTGFSYTKVQFAGNDYFVHVVYNQRYLVFFRQICIMFEKCTMF